MKQTLLSLGALAFIMVASYNLQRSNAATEKRIIENEVTVRLTGVGTEVLEYVGSRFFDAVMVPSHARYDDEIASEAELSPLALFGPSETSCDYETCTAIEQFHGLDSLSFSRNGLIYDASISVRYVDEADPSATVATQTFAKEVAVTLTSRNMQTGESGNFLSGTMTRIFTYEAL